MKNHGGEHSSVTLFYSYSVKDESLRAELETHLAILRRAGLLTTWSCRCIEAGQDWRKEIGAALEHADIILLLVSADFLASDYCWDVELKRALERERRGEAIVIPVILKDCDWQVADFARLQALPTGVKPLARWKPRDKGWTNVVQSLRQRIEALRAGHVVLHGRRLRGR